MNPTSLLRLGLVILLHDSAVQADDMGTLVVLEELECSTPIQIARRYPKHTTGTLKNVRIHDIGMGDGSLLRNLVDAELAFGCVEQQVDDSLCPVCTITEQTQVGEWLLRTSKLALLLTKLVRELDEQLAVAVSLVLGKGEDTRDVVVLGRLFLFGEVANDVTSLRVAFRLRLHEHLAPDKGK